KGIKAYNLWLITILFFVFNLFYNNLIRLGGVAQIRVYHTVTFWKFSFQIFLIYRGRYNYILTHFPVYRSGDIIFGGELEGIQHPKNFCKISARRGRISDYR